MARVVVSMACLAASSVLYYAGTGLHPVPWLVWLAPLPVLWVALRVRWQAAFALAGLAWIAGATNVWTYFVRDIQLPVPAAVAFLALGGVALGAAALAFRALIHDHPLVAVLAVPAMWVSAEYVVSLVLPHGSWWSLAYTQAPLPVVMQTAAVAGTPGISFLLFLVPAAAAAIIHIGPRRAVVATTVLTIAAAAVFGTARLATTPSAAGGDPVVRVGLLAIGHPGGNAVRLPGAGTPLLDAYLAGARDLALGGATVIVGPEAVFRLTEADLPELTGPLTEIARQHRVTVIVGAIVEGRQVNNTAVIVGPDGDPHRYAKRHLIPGLEDGITPGQRPELLPGEPTIGVLICKDMDFTDLPRSYRRAGAALLAVPAWDFDRDGPLHATMAITRGIETGTVVARSARTGTLTASDTRGRGIAEAAYDPRGTVKLVADLPLASSPTPYTLLGDWLAWLCLLGTILATALATRKRRPRTTTPTTASPAQSAHPAAAHL